MTYATTHSRVLLGLDAVPVRIHARVFSRGNAPPRFRVQGIPDVAARELRVRVESSISALTSDLQDYSVDVVIAPELAHGDPGLDLPVAVAVGQALRRAHMPDSSGPGGESIMFAGELTLDGRLRRIRGVLPLVAPLSPAVEWIVPLENGPEAARSGRRILTACTLVEAVSYLGGRPLPLAVEAPRSTPAEHPTSSLYRDLPPAHQAHVREIVELASDGRWGTLPAVVLLVGPPGGGKTIIARAIRDELMPLDNADDLNVSCVYSAAGLLEADGHLRGRPFRAPHHTVSEAGLVGGGDRPRPGEASLAHRGVLFLDELPEFRPAPIEALGRALRRGKAEIARSGETVTFPACPAVVVLAANSCPCGFHGHPTRTCRCPPASIDRYQARLWALFKHFDGIGVKKTIHVEPIDLSTLRRAEV